MVPLEAEGSDRIEVEMDSTRNLRIFVALALVAIAILPFGRSLSPSVRGAGYTAGPVLHTSTGHFFAIEYDTSLSAEQIQIATGYVNQYIPQLFNLFWEPQEDAYIVVTQGGCGGYSCGGSDGVSILQSSWSYPNVWVHEFTHVLQFYGGGPGLLLSGEAFLLYAEPMAMVTADILAPFNPPPDCCSDLSFWNKDQGVGLAVNDYALQSSGESHVPVNVWRMLHEADPNIFKEINSHLYQLAQQYIHLSDIPSFRELIRQSTQLQTLDNLSIKQWLAVEGFLGRNEVGGTSITYVGTVNYYSLSSTQQSVQAIATVATPNGFNPIDKTQSQGTVYDAITKTKLADLQIQSATDTPQSVSFQANLALQSPPTMVQLNLRIVAGGFTDNRSILAPLTQYQGYLGTPTLGAKGLIAIPTSDMWLQTVNGNANANGQSYPITNGFGKLNLDGSATVTLSTGPTPQITGFLQSQQMALGLDYTAIKLMQDTNTITTSTQTFTQTFSTSSTPTVTIVDTTSLSTISSSTTSSSSTSNIVQTTSSSSSTQVPLITISNVATTTSFQNSTSIQTQSSSTTNIPQQQPVSDFSLSASLSVINLAQSSSGVLTVSVQSAESFDQQVYLEATGLPSGVQASFSPNPIATSQGGTTSATASLVVARSVPTGSYSFTITAISGSISKQVPLTLRVAGCLIATATYGSELAPEVQSLRDFRDFKILHTFAGSSFMVAFNTWYYSFSPSVAQYESGQPTMRTALKFLLYPLIWILKLGSVVFDLFSFNQEAAVIISGLTVSVILSIVYLAGPLTIARLSFSPKARRVARKLEKATFSMIVYSLSIVLLSETLSSQMLMMMATSTVVLSSIVTSALWTSRYGATFCKLKK